MSGAVLLALVVAATVATVPVFSSQARGGQGRLDRGVLAAPPLFAALVAALVVPAARLNWPLTAVLVTALVLAGAVLAPAPAGWSAVGAVCWGTVLVAVCTYLVLTAVWTAGAAGVLRPAAVVLWLIEVVVALLVVSRLRDVVTMLTLRLWRRRTADGVAQYVANARLPFVSIHVPVRNEPLGLVVGAIDALTRLDYPAFEVVVVDGSDDEEAWRPIEAICAQNPSRLRFHHLQGRSGGTAGALNHALSVADPRAEIVAVVGSDHVVRPDYLRACAPLFLSEPELGFVQTGSDYRDWEQSAYHRRLYFALASQASLSQVCRNEHDAAVLDPTMGLVRRSALDHVGGWDEWCVSEGPELSLRLRLGGWSGRYVETAFGRGVLPPSFAAVKRQQFRRCYGGVQLLRRHWRALLPELRPAERRQPERRQPERRLPELRPAEPRPAESRPAEGLGRPSGAARPEQRVGVSRLDRAQRWTYLAAGLQSFGEAASSILALLTVAAVLDAAFGPGLGLRRLSGLLLFCAPLLIAVALLTPCSCFPGYAPT